MPDATAPRSWIGPQLRLAVAVARQQGPSRSKATRRWPCGPTAAVTVFARPVPAMIDGAPKRPPGERSETFTTRRAPLARAIHASRPVPSEPTARRGTNATSSTATERAVPSDGPSAEPNATESRTRRAGGIEARLQAAPRPSGARTAGPASSRPGACARRRTPPRPARATRRGRRVVRAVADAVLEAPVRDDRAVAARGGLEADDEGVRRRDRRRRRPRGGGRRDGGGERGGGRGDGGGEGGSTGACSVNAPRGRKVAAEKNSGGPSMRVPPLAGLTSRNVGRRRSSFDRRRLADGDPSTSRPDALVGARVVTGRAMPVNVKR